MRLFSRSAIPQDLHNYTWQESHPGRTRFGSFFRKILLIKTFELEPTFGVCALTLENSCHRPRLRPECLFGLIPNNALLMAQGRVGGIDGGDLFVRFIRDVARERKADWLVKAMTFHAPKHHIPCRLSDAIADNVLRGQEASRPYSDHEGEGR